MEELLLWPSFYEGFSSEDTDSGQLLLYADSADL